MRARAALAGSAVFLSTVGGPLEQFLPDGAPPLPLWCPTRGGHIIREFCEPFLSFFIFFFTFIKFHSRLLYAAGCQMSGLSGMSNANADLKGSTTALLRRLLRHKCAWGGTTTAATTTASSSASIDFSYCFFVALLVMEDEMAKPGCPTCERDRTPRFFSGDGPRALPCAVFFIGC